MKIFFTNFFILRKPINTESYEKVQAKVQKSKLIQGHHKKSVGSETWI